MTIEANLWNKNNRDWRELKDSTTVTWDVSVNHEITATALIVDGTVSNAKLADGAVSNAKLADMAQSTIKGRAAGAGTGDPQDLTGTQATALLNAFTGDSGSGGVKGLVPAPASGDGAAGKVLKADGTWGTQTSVGLVLLTSGTVSAQAALDIVLTSYSAYRGIKIFLYSFVPVTDDVELWMRFSTDGGANYDATGYSFANMETRDAGGEVFSMNSNSAAQISVCYSTTSGEAVSNVATEGGANCEITIMDFTNTGRQTAAFWTSTWFGATVADTFIASGGGRREATQDTDAVRFLFQSGNIASGGYAVYGLA